MTPEKYKAYYESRQPHRDRITARRQPRQPVFVVGKKKRGGQPDWYAVKKELRATIRQKAREYMVSEIKNEVPLTNWQTTQWERAGRPTDRTPFADMEKTNE